MPFFGGGGASASNMVGATSSAAGTAGLVPQPASGAQQKFLRGDATFQSIANETIPVTPSRRTNAISVIFPDATYAGRGTSTGFVLCAPLYVRETKAYTTFSVYVSGAGTASSVGKLAIYSINTSGVPASLICQSGTFATDSIGLKQPTMSSTVVNAGWYYVIFGTNSSATVTIHGNPFHIARGMISGAVSGGTPELIDYSTKAYANLWPDPWDGSNSFSNAYHIICELT